MANIYVDFDAGLDTNNGTTWALAFKTVEAALEDATNGAAAGDTVFVRRTDAGVAGTDYKSTSRTIVSSGTKTNPVTVVGCKDGTTAAPPADSDIARRSDAQPSLGTNNTTADMTVTGAISWIGMELSLSVGSFADLILQNYHYLVECTLDVALDIRLKGSDVRGPSGILDLDRVDITLRSSGSQIDLGQTNTGSAIRMKEVSVTHAGTPTNSMFNARYVALECIGCDFTGWGSGKTLINVAFSPVLACFTDCKLPASMTLIAGNLKYDIGSTIEMVRCASGTKISGQSFIQYHRQNVFGICRASTAVTRTGGAADGASGGFSLELEPNVNATLEGRFGVASTPIVGWVAGDGTTTRTVTVFFNNDSGADLNEGDVLIRLFAPPGDGDAQAQQGLNYTGFLGTATALTDDTVSTWAGLTANGNPQKAVFTFSGVNAPDYEGPVHAIVEFQKRYAATPKRLYVDPKLDIV